MKRVTELDELKINMRELGDIIKRFSGKIHELVNDVSFEYELNNNDDVRDFDDRITRIQREIEILGKNISILTDKFEFLDHRVNVLFSRSKEATPDIASYNLQSSLGPLTTLGSKPVNRAAAGAPGKRPR
jgi:predicted RNase H-like nuclease (RuvC/YqgF family)